MVTIPSLVRASTFGSHIGRIVSMSTQEQVIWVDAFPVIAVVANKQSIRYRAYMNLVGNPVRERPFPIAFYFPISMPIYLARPLPAACLQIADVLLLKPIQQWSSLTPSHETSLIG